MNATEKAAQALDHIMRHEVRFVVQSDFDDRADLLSESCPKRSLEDAVAYMQTAFAAGATEVRIRPFIAAAAASPAQALPASD